MIVMLEAWLWAMAGLGALVYYKPLIRRHYRRKELAASHARIAQLERDVGLGEDSFERRLEEAIGPQFHSLEGAYPLALLEPWQRSQLQYSVHPSEVEIWHAPDYPAIRVKPGWVRAFAEAHEGRGFHTEPGR